MHKLVEGRPIRVEGRELAPLVQVETRVRRTAFVGQDGQAGHARATMHMRPVAILERDATGEERRFPVHDRTAQLLGGLLLAAWIIPLLLALAVRLARGR